ncbi:MAG: glycosyltransferase [Deltaproteobacteria bacterium]|nr:glycosyltransferase [Deltaproteobacteria bacterium]MBW1922253.1 glycosyltransferase [Deltaproteobacteria bacterium]MBW1949528.1 glycosyltransferase [Deltaproteobacteria bacterium]MBW2008421.1 glycosyltransferase [Deltaproteobacteria bacterium]MBW2102183.1 glycosyltransferase [Deltaproteobacteria bacterium]
MSDSQSLVTIVIPSFNQGRYLPACVDHCLFQTYPNLEIIIVDGGSTDTTKEWLKTLRHEIASASMDPVQRLDENGEIVRQHIRTRPANRRIEIVTFAEDIGPTRTINEGLKRARGKYCTYVVGDDLPHPHMIEEMAAALERLAVDFVYSDMNIVDDDGRIIRQVRLPDYDFSVCLAEWYHLGVSRLYRTELHQQVGLMDESYSGANDYDHHLRFAMAGCRFYHLPRILYSVRWHGEERKTGQHSPDRYANLVAESKQCAMRARIYLERHSRTRSAGS